MGPFPAPLNDTWANGGSVPRARVIEVGLEIPGDSAG